MPTAKKSTKTSGARKAADVSRPAPDAATIRFALSLGMAAESVEVRWNRDGAVGGAWIDGRETTAGELARLAEQTIGAAERANDPRVAAWRTARTRDASEKSASDDEVRRVAPANGGRPRPPLTRERAAKLTAAVDLAERVRADLDVLVRDFVAAPRVSEELQESAIRMIERAAKAIGGSTIATMKRREFVRAVLIAARAGEGTERVGAELHSADLRQKVNDHPKAVAALLAPLAARPRKQGDARKQGGRTKGDAPGKWEGFPAAWQVIGDEETDAQDWEKLGPQVERALAREQNPE